MAPYREKLRAVAIIFILGLSAAVVLQSPVPLWADPPPPAAGGDKGKASPEGNKSNDSFDSSVGDGGIGADTGTVTIPISGRIWFINNPAGSAGGAGADGGGGIGGGEGGSASEDKKDEEKREKDGKKKKTEKRKEAKEKKKSGEPPPYVPPPTKEEDSLLYSNMIPLPTPDPEPPKEAPKPLEFDGLLGSWSNARNFGGLQDGFSQNSSSGSSSNAPSAECSS